jgi:hypothetical protein
MCTADFIRLQRILLKYFGCSIDMETWFWGQSMIWSQADWVSTYFKWCDWRCVLLREILHSRRVLEISLDLSWPGVTWTWKPEVSSNSDSAVTSSSGILTSTTVTDCDIMIIMDSDTGHDDPSPITESLPGSVAWTVISSWQNGSTYTGTSWRQESPFKVPELKMSTKF